MEGLVEFLTSNMLLTMAGASLATVAIVQIFKDMVKLETRIFAFLVAFVLVFGSSLLVMEVLEPKAILALLLTTVANAALVAVGAIGEHQVLQKLGVLS